MEEKTLILEGLPDDFASVKSKLELHFRNRRKSGGDIFEMRSYPNDRRKALLVYVEDEAVKRVLEKGPHKIDFKGLGVVELQVKPLQEDGIVNVKRITPVPMPRLRLENETGSGKSARDIGESEPGPLCQEGLRQDCGEKALSLHVTSDCPIKEEILQLYFEQFTDDVDICRHGDNQWILKLTSQSDLENVLAKKHHDLDGSLMSVQLYDEREAEKRLDPHRFILTGFSEDCKCSHLSIFIKSCSKGAEHSWEVLKDGNRIAVTFKQNIDVQAFLKKCSTKKLQNMDISASRLEYTNSVLVEGNMENISEEALRIYFCSTQNNWGKVNCLIWDKKAKSALIVFEDFHVATRVAKEKHNICGVNLRGLLFYSSLQQALTGETPTMPPSPHKISIPVDALLLEYIQNDKLCKEDFQSTLKELYTSIFFKSDPEFSQVVLEMAVDRESLLLHRLAHSWERKTKQAVEALLEKYSIVTLMSTEEVWERVKDKCLSLSLKTASVSFESAKNTVVVLGQRNDVKKLQGEIQLLLEVEKNTVERKIPVDSKEELDFVWNLVSDKLGGVEHMKDEANLTFHLKGLKDKVNAAEGIIKNIKDHLTTKTLHLSPHLAKFFQTLDLRELERDHFTHISAKVFSCGDSIQILSEMQDGEKARDKINEVLMEEMINLTPDQRKVTQEEHWRVFDSRLMQEVESSNNAQNVKISHSDVQISVCGFRNVVTDVARKLTGYLNNKMPVTKEIPLKSLRQVEYVDACMRLSEAPEIKALDVTILLSRTQASPCLKVTAASDNIKEALSAVEKQISHIVHEKHIYSNAGESKVLEKHRDTLKARAKEFACKLYLTVEQASQTSCHLASRFKIGDCLTLTIAQGEISQQTAEAVVCPLGGNLSFDNPVAQKILQVGGPQIKDVCDKLLKENHTLVAGDVVAANPGNLPAKALFYAVIPTWFKASQPWISQSLRLMHLASAVKKSLQIAENSHCVSMVMPALGCGTFGFPVRESCKAIEKEISEFCDSHLDSPQHLREVIIVDPDSKTVEELHTVLREMGYQSTDSMNTALSPPANKTKQATPPLVLPKPRADLKVAIGGMTVILKEGDITKESVDAIVNSTNISLNLDTGVSGAILKAAGKSVVDECTKLGTQKADGVVVTGGGDLKCKHIIQMVGPTTTTGITSSIERVLQLCESKNTTDMAIPAIGTGRGNILPEESIKAILMGLQNHLSQTTSTSIKLIFIVAFEQTVFNSFCNYFAERNQQSHQRKEAVTGFRWPSFRSRSTQLPANQVKIHGIRIEVRKGDITIETVRGIVNSTNKELNLKGGVSGAIFRAAGSSVEEECKGFGPQQDDGVVVTSGGALQCDFIIHMVGPHTLAAATSNVEKVLEQCEKNQITTVSFPAIGTGGGQLNAADVIKAMLQGFHNHLSQQISTVLKLIYIVVNQDKIFQEFIQGLKQWSKPGLDSSCDEDEDVEADEAWSTRFELDSTDEDMDVDEDDYEGSVEIIMGSIKVKALCGDITKETTDAIVSSTNSSLDLSSGVSGAILKAAGQTVMDECRALGKQPSNGVVVTKPGNLKSKHIVHMVGQTEERAITNSMLKVLETCDRIKAQSVSFPSLGTGAGNLAASQVANAMIDAIYEFVLIESKPSVTSIHIVIFQPKMMSDFKQVMKKFKTVNPKLRVAAAMAAHRRPRPTSPNSSLSLTIPNLATPSLESAAASITFPMMVAEVYGVSAANLAQVKKCLDELISEECASQDVVAEHLHLLAETEKQDIVEAGQRHQVRISIMQNKVNVSGKRDDVLSAVLQIKDSLLRARDREYQEREESRIWKTVRWEVGRSDAWIGLDQHTNNNLELAFHREHKLYVYQHQRDSFKVDFEKMQQTDSRGNITRIKRTPLSDSETVIITIPPTWTKMDGKDLDIIVLLEKSNEFQKISKEFVQSCQVFAQTNSKNIEVVQIQRIQHQGQWRRYTVSKKALDKKYPKNNNEQLLYHGTTKDISQKITKNGFNRSFCGRNATRFGSGTYFAKEADYSCENQYSNPDAKGHKYIYRARVLTGKPCVGLEGMREPAPVDPNNLQAGLHDCAVDKLQNPFIFVIFCDSGAYPEYLITFKTV